MKNNDNLKEKEIKQEKSMDKKELESVSGGGYPRWWGFYSIDPDICKGGADSSCAFDCITACKKGIIYRALDEKNNPGNPKINRPYCDNCGDCEACPRKAIVFWKSPRLPF